MQLQCKKKSAAQTVIYEDKNLKHIWGVPPIYVETTYNPLGGLSAQKWELRDTLMVTTVVEVVFNALYGNSFGKFYPLVSTEKFNTAARWKTV